MRTCLTRLKDDEDLRAVLRQDLVRFPSTSKSQAYGYSREQVCVWTTFAS